MLEPVLQTASDIRLACERYYSALTKRGVPHMFDQNLCCMCAIASASLHKQLTKEGIDCLVYTGNFLSKTGIPCMHAWVELLPCRTIVDITATQFGDSFPKVLITSPNQEFFAHYQRETKISQNLNTWMIQQRATTKVVNAVLRRRPKRYRPLPKITLPSLLENNPLQSLPIAA
jgi:hypothetical protein